MRGTTGLFFALFVLRTGISSVASTLFGVSESTGGRAFIAWAFIAGLGFLAKTLRPVVRLPVVEDIVQGAPPNSCRKGLSSVALVFDATEYSPWQDNAARAL